MWYEKMMWTPIGQAIPTFAFDTNAVSSNSVAIEG
jgi:hypothetical protein